MTAVFLLKVLEIRPNKVIISPCGCIKKIQLVFPDCWVYEPLEAYKILGFLNLLPLRAFLCPPLYFSCLLIR